MSERSRQPVAASKRAASTAKVEAHITALALAKGVPESSFCISSI